MFAILLPSVAASLYFYTSSSESEPTHKHENGHGHGHGHEIGIGNGKANENGNWHVSPISSVHTNGNVPDNQITKMSTTINTDFNNTEKPNSSETMEIPKFSLSHAIQRIGRHIRTSYSSPTVIQWSILWALSMCGFLQVRSIKSHYSMKFFGSM